MATAASESETVEVLSEVFDCPICLERLCKPKYLPCLHTFCESCLGTYIVSTNTELSSPESFQCPVCRQETQCPDPNSSIEEWAKLIPLNHMIFSLMESSGNLGDKNEMNCGPCERDEETTPAKFWCNECLESFCEMCKKSHKRFVPTANHNVITIGEGKIQSRKIPELEETCPDHKGEVLKVYCVDHKKMCCVICLSINHRKCEDIKTFDEMADKMKNNGDTTHLSNTMADICSKVDKLRVRKEQNIDKIEKQKQDMLKETSDLVEKAIKTLKKCHENFETRFSQAHKEQHTKLTDSKERLENMRKTLTNGEKILKAVSEHGSLKQLFITSEKLRVQLDNFGEEVARYLDEDRDINYELKLEEKLTSFTTMTSVAEIQVKAVLIDEPTLENDKQPSSMLATNKTDDLRGRLRSADIDDIEAVKVWDVIGKGRYTGCVFLQDGNLLLSDTKRCTLDIYDECGKLQMSHSLDYWPWDVVQNKDGIILVSRYPSGGVKMYSLLQNQLSEVQSISVTGKPRAIAVLKDNILIEIGGQIHIVTNKGEVIRKVPASYNTYIAASETTEPCFYYRYNDDVICQSLNGKELLRHTLNNIRFKTLRGIALDGGNNIYVCGRDSGNILIISKDGKFSRILMSTSDTIALPYAIRFDKTGTQFLVTSYENGIVALYRLNLKK